MAVGWQPVRKMWADLGQRKMFQTPANATRMNRAALEQRQAMIQSAVVNIQSLNLQQSQGMVELSFKAAQTRRANEMQAKLDTAMGAYADLKL